MKKKIISALALLTITVFGIFAQQIERLTFTDMRADGTIIGTVTVNAIFMCYSQQRITYEGNFTVTYERTYYNGEWSDWEFMRREPALVPTLRQHYDLMLSGFSRNPRGSVRLNFGNGLQAVRIFTIRSGGSTPFSWSEDGRSFYALYEFWAIEP